MADNGFRVVHEVNPNDADQRGGARCFPNFMCD